MGFDSIKAHQQFKDGKLSKHAVFSQPGLCMVDVYCARPGQSQPVHGHEHATKCYAVIEGRARITIGDEVREVGPGDLAFAPLGKDIVPIDSFAGGVSWSVPN